MRLCTHVILGSRAYCNSRPILDFFLGVGRQEGRLTLPDLAVIRPQTTGAECRDVVPASECSLVKSRDNCGSRT